MKIVCRTPVRVSLGNGGDTDYYTKEIGWGCVLNVTLASHFYEFEINDNNDKKIDIVDYFDLNNLNRTHLLESDVSELDLLKATLKELNHSLPNSYVVRTNVPMKAGLGGSSSLNVGMIAVLLQLQEKEIDPERIAAIAYDIERKRMGIPGGYQDQYAAACGCGFNFMTFKPEKVEVENLNLSEETIKKLEKRIVMYYLAKRGASGSSIHDHQKKNAEQNPEEVKRLLIEKRDNAVKIKEALLKGNLDEFGERLKKEGDIKNKITGKSGSGFATKIIENGYSYGALGSKFSGAGGGGCVMFYVPENKIDSFKEKMAKEGVMEMHYRFQRGFEKGITLKVIN
tara:strand:+ start:1825 stop:2847 length:1023 start_codon:yes stop_codon:yes gene_type:complete